MPRAAILIVAVAVPFVLTACSGSSAAESLGDPVAGKAAFASTCVPCHGADAQGVPGLGKDLTTSDLLVQRSDQDVVEFLMTGRPASDPSNTTGIDMPAKGGNPAFTAQDLRNIVAYLRTIRK